MQLPLLDLKTDIVFKMYFSKAENQDLLIDFISAIIKPEAPIKEIKILNPILLNKLIGHKESILDLRLKLDSGVQLDVEMQMLKKRYFKNRLLYYWAKLHHGQIEIGEDYKFLKKTVSIAVLNYLDLDLDCDDEQFHHIFEVRNRKSGKIFVHDLEMHLIELPKLEKIKNLGHIEKWGRFFLGELDDIEGDEMMAKAKTALMELSADELAYHMAWDREESERERLTIENEQKENQKIIEESSLALKKQQEDYLMQIREFDKNKEVFDKNKEEFDKNKVELDKNKVELDKNKEEFDKEKAALNKEKEELVRMQAELAKQKRELEALVLLAKKNQNLK